MDCVNNYPYVHLCQRCLISLFFSSKFTLLNSLLSPLKAKAPKKVAILTHGWVFKRQSAFHWKLSFSSEGKVLESYHSHLKAKCLESYHSHWRQSAFHWSHHSHLEAKCLPLKAIILIWRQSAFHWQLPFSSAGRRPPYSSPGRFFSQGKVPFIIEDANEEGEPTPELMSHLPLSFLL